MAENYTKDALADVWIKRLKNHPIGAALIVFTLILTSVASLTDSFDKLGRFALRISQEPEALIPILPDSSIKRAKDKVTSPKANEQTTHGDNSPAVADVQGDVKISINQQENQK